MGTAGIVLCGGRSARMGRPKAWLPVGGEPMLRRVVRLVRAAVGPVVVVAAPGQDVPPLPADVPVVRDAVGGCGPLGGLAAGLAAHAGRADVVYLSACDVPLLDPAFVRRVVALLSEPLPPDTRSGPSAGLRTPAPLAAVPRVGDRLHPLAAAYRADVLPVVRDLLAADRLRLTGLFDAVPTRFIGADELADLDPAFRSLWNLNAPDEYAAALRELDRLGSG